VTKISPVIERPMTVPRRSGRLTVLPRSAGSRLTVLPGGRDDHPVTGDRTAFEAISPTVLERDAEIDTLLAALAEAAAGCSSVVLVTGEAGIGKTSVVRAFRAVVDGDVRVLSGACDDLLTPRTLGPLRDAVVGTGGPLERALAVDRSSESIFAAITEEFAGPQPTVLVVEDVHWADDATLDVLRYLARRLDRLKVVLLLTVRDDAVGSGHPLRQLLGAFAVGQVHRLALRPLSPTAVGLLSSGSGRDPAALHALTTGNPFFVTEMLAAPGDTVPRTVVDSVLAQARRLDPDARLACEQLSVVPTQVDFELAEALLGDRMDALAAAEERGIIEVRADGVSFRHELARRAIEDALPAIRRRVLNRAVVAALQKADSPDLTRLVHHAVQAHDATAVLTYAPLAGRQASRAGSHRQALAHVEAALRYADRLAPEERAALLDDYARALHVAHRFSDAVRAGQQAVNLREKVGEPVALNETLLRLSRHLYLAGRTDDAQAVVGRAMRVLEATGAAPALAAAATYRGTLLALTGDCRDAVAALEQARTQAATAGRTDLVALCLAYLGVALAELGDPHGVAHLQESLAMATANGDDESAAHAYTNLSELLYRDGRWEELADCLETGLAFTRGRGFWLHTHHLEVHAALLLMRRGDWTSAEEQLHGLVEKMDEPGPSYVYSAAALGRLRARRGDSGAESLVVEAWEHAQRQRSLSGLAYAGLAYVEWAWLAGQPERAAAVRDVLLARTEPAGAAPLREELLRYLARAGLGGAPFDGCRSTCTEAWAAGLRGDWRVAAAAWGRTGDSYEQALELAESNDMEPTLEALQILDGLGAAPAATLVRRRLRDLGMRRIPRGARAATRTNPAGLTQRQIDVLTLIPTGMTNAEIAERLVVSARTVEHHVSAILSKLGVQTRRDAAAAARSLGLDASVR
jgi:ATP/maltotriose-dependent transcriptional regulator MalT